MRVWLGLVALTIIAAGCGDSATNQKITGPTELSVRPLCKAGCQESDPDPEAPGVFLGSSVTEEACAGGSQTDHDADGLSTFCEENLAAAFAPELRYYNLDEVGREPYWAARPISYGDASTVFIAYFIGYYRDVGSDVAVCHLPFAPESCNGHNGDSEAIILQVYYDPTSSHWVLAGAKYSQHTSYFFYSKEASAYPTALYYPGHAGSYPRAYVAEGKHANYASVSACNAGGEFGTDSCTHVNTSERVFVSGAYNLGSNATRLIDCVPSRDPSYVYYGSGREECFWTTRNFRGWIPTSVGGAESSPYADRLVEAGFIPQ